MFQKNSTIRDLGDTYKHVGWNQPDQQAQVIDHHLQVCCEPTFSLYFIEWVIATWLGMSCSPVNKVLEWLPHDSFVNSSESAH